VQPEGSYFFNHREILRELLRLRGVKKGRWQLVFELQHAALNLRSQSDPASVPVLTPASVVMIQRVGIMPTHEVNDLTMDSSEIYGKSKRATRGPLRKPGKRK
jgi:hypothetical protein